MPRDHLCTLWAAYTPLCAQPFLFVTMSCDVGLYGLAVMGQNFALNMAEHGFTVAVCNRSPGKVDDCGLTSRTLSKHPPNYLGENDLTSHVTICRLVSWN